jgi:ATP/maltotriose-dependent transcriptional regulator MalT
MLLIAQGNIEEGVKALEMVLGELPKGAFFVHYAEIHATLAEALGKLGAISRAHATVDAALERAERDDEPWHMAEFMRIKGELIQLEGGQAHFHGPRRSFGAPSTAPANNKRSPGICGPQLALRG